MNKDREREGGTREAGWGKHGGGNMVGGNRVGKTQELLFQVWRQLTALSITAICYRKYAKILLIFNNALLNSSNELIH
jgi:hypothetical protein